MSHHSPFQSLSPLSWSTDIAPLSPSSFDDLITSTFTDAQLLIDSIPPLPKTTPSSAGRARSHTDSSAHPVLSVRSPSKKEHGHSEMAHKLSRDWKDVKTPQNQLGIAMYKISSGEGGAWFARRSLHRLTPAESFEKWEMGLRREMGDTLEKKVGEGRGLGAERWLGGREDGSGRVDLYHVSARFPGPTAPRDFVTLMIMPKEEEPKREAGKRRAPRQLMIISRPCDHPDSPPRPGFVRGSYQSVEVIREVPVEKPLRRVRSSVDLSRDEQNRASTGEHLSREAVLRAAERAVGHGAESEGEGEGRAASFRLSNDGDESDTEMALEWLLITRSDPGGNVPRFMVEKGTPGGVVNDALKFVKWLSSKTMEDLRKPQTFRDNGMIGQEMQPSGELLVEEQPQQVSTTTPVEEDQRADGEPEDYEEELPPASNSGVYVWLTSALGAATSAVANRVLGDAALSIRTDSEINESDNDDDSEASFASAEDGTPQTATNTATNTAETISALDTASTRSAHSTLSEPASRSLSREPTPSVSQAQSQHEKELNKLQDRMRKAQEKLERSQAQRRAKHSSNGNNGDGETEKEREKDDRALAKLREKHAHQVVRQEEKYQRELQRLATKRAADERKAAERRQKAARREERTDLAMELDRVRTERDVARKEVEMLRERVGELQGQNTMLVARLGRGGVDLGGLVN